MPKDFNPFVKQAENDIEQLQARASSLGCPPQDVLTAVAINRLAASQKELAGVIDEGFRALTSAVYQLKASYDYERKHQRKLADNANARRDRAKAEGATAGSDEGVASSS